MERVNLSIEEKLKLNIGDMYTALDRIRDDLEDIYPNNDVFCDNLFNQCNALENMLNEMSILIGQRHIPTDNY